MRNAVRMVLVAVVLVAVASPGMAGVYDDVRAWWHLDYADSGAITANAQATNEIRDQRLWGSNGGYKATAVNGTPEWTSSGVPALGPAGGLTRGGRALVLDDSSGSEGFEVNNLSVAGDAALALRYKWDGSIEHGGAATIYSNGFGWSANKGWMLRLTGAGDPQFYYGQGNSTNAGWTTTPGEWYDLAVVLDEDGASDTVTFYRNGPGGAVEKVTRSVNWFGGEVNSTTTRVGYEGTNYKYFGGELESIALWGRALSETDVQDAFRSPDPAWSLGIDNGTSDDLRLESQADADYTLGEPWHEMRRAVTAGNNQANVHFDLDANQAALQYVGHVNVSTVGAGTGSIALLVNGHNLGTRTVTAGDDVTWLVSANALNVGANVATIQYGSGTWVSLDWLELGGAWQVGTDNNSAGEFEAEWLAGDDFYITDPNLKHLERAITAGDPDIDLHFNLSDVLAEFSYLYTTRVVSQAGNDPANHPFDILVNGILAASYATQPDNTQIDLLIGSDWLHAGDNVITLRYQSPNGWSQFDFHRLQAVPEPATLSLLGLGALMAVRRRRRG